jgi:hypothetical protein
MSDDTCSPDSCDDGCRDCGSIPDTVWKDCRIGFDNYEPQESSYAQVRTDMRWNGWPLIRLERDGVQYWMQKAFQGNWTWDGDTLVIQFEYDDETQTVTPENGWYEIPDGYVWEIICRTCCDCGDDIPYESEQDARTAVLVRYGNTAQCDDCRAREEQEVL